MSREEGELQELLGQISANQPSHVRFISKVLIREVKKNGNYQTGEQLFDHLIKTLKEKKVSRPTYVYSEMEISAFQRSIATLVRYAPTAEKARYMFNLTLREYQLPLRTVALELILLNNLLFVHSQFNEMKDALTIIETALEIGAFQLDPRNYYDKYDNAKFSDPLQVFETLSGKVLRHYRLEFNEDKTALKRITK
ncbi:hypothetical protein INT47_012290 [Mucor saturninus]|uniref:Uncharacterized protein n=1 Tax=Mucor saturninus TaxID=64648 RepID=A0A8H7RBF5_9FUNG|nr:hypothetical protein INT47_012290 [Mucor saturninus]